MKFLKRIREAKPFQRLRQRFAAKVLGYGGIGALVIGLVSQLIGVELAPTEVDVLMTAAATIAAVYGRWQAAR